MPYRGVAIAQYDQPPQQTSESLYRPIEFIKGRLYFVCLPIPPTTAPADVHYFTIDDTLVYSPFYADFGPLNLAHMYRFCQLLKGKLSSPLYAKKKICLFAREGDKRTNAALLLAAFFVLTQEKNAEEAYKPLVGVSPPFLSFRDAGYGPSTYHITILDILKGIQKAMACGFIDFDNFNVEEYEYYEKVENGDLNWVLPGKFIAFAGPHMNKIPGLEHFKCLPTDYVPFFKKSAVQVVIRLNNKEYDAKKFTDQGIDHQELYFADGTTPPEPILRRFMLIAESTPGVLAVHCKAGLGRTGTLIALYIMKHYRFTASEVISYLRVMRPGSVVGPQQNYLQSMQVRMWGQTSVDSPIASIRAADKALIPVQPNKRQQAVNAASASGAAGAATATLSKDLKGLSIEGISTASAPSARSASTSATSRAASPAAPGMVAAVAQPGVSSTPKTINAAHSGPERRVLASGFIKPY